MRCAAQRCNARESQREGESARFAEPAHSTHTHTLPAVLTSLSALTELLPTFTHTPHPRIRILTTHPPYTRLWLSAVLSGGKVVEKGTHEELLRQGGEYAKMVKSQSLAARHSDSKAPK